MHAEPGGDLSRDELALLEDEQSCAAHAQDARRLLERADAIIDRLLETKAITFEEADILRLIR